MLNAKSSIWTRIPFFGNLGFPIAEKEVRSLMRRNRYFWGQFFYLAVIAAGVSILIASTQGRGVSPEVTSRSLFCVFFAVQNVLTYLVFPAFAATAISGERVEKSLDLLITTDLRPTEIVWGKFLGIFGNCCYFFLVTLPILATCILFGGVSIGQALESYVLLLVQAAVLTIFGIFVSSASSSNIRAIIGTYVVSFAVGWVATAALVVFYEESGANLSPIGYLLDQVPPPLGILTVLSVALLATFTFGLCFAGAVQRLTSPEGNRSTPLRLLAFAATAAALILSAVFQSTLTDLGHLSRVKDQFEYLVVAFGFLGFVLLVVLPVFASERVKTPLKVARFAKQRPLAALLAWIFLPGGVRGFAFAALLGLGFTLTFRALAHRGGLAGSTAFSVVEPDALSFFLTTVGVCAAGVFLYCALAFFFSALGVRGFLNWALVGGIVTLANLYPLVFAIGEREPSIFHLYEVSPLVVLLGYSGESVRYRTPQEILLSVDYCLLLHVGLGIALLLVTFLVLRKRGVAVWRPARAGLSEAGAA